MVEGRCAMALRGRWADERRGARDGRPGGVAAWRQENVPELWKLGLEHHTDLVVCFLEKWYLVKSSQQKIR